MAYPRLKEYGLHSYYILSAIEVAYSVYRIENRKSIPFFKKAFLKLDNQSYQLSHLLLRIPTTPGNFVFLTLEGSRYRLSYVDDPGLKRGSVIITPNSVIIAFTKEIELHESTGFVGIDVNERKVSISATDGWSQRFGELGNVVELKERHREIRATISRTTRGDRRTAKELLSKYGRREEEEHPETARVVAPASYHWQTESCIAQGATGHGIGTSHQGT